MKQNSQKTRVEMVKGNEKRNEGPIEKNSSDKYREWKEKVESVIKQIDFCEKKRN